MTNEAKEALRNDWETRAVEFRASGLSVPKWCYKHDLKPHQRCTGLRDLAKVHNHRFNGSPVT